MALAGCTLPTPTASGGDGAEWPMAGGSASRTGAQGTGADGLGEEAWRAAVGASLDRPPIPAGQYVLAAGKNPGKNSSPFLSALHAGNGSRAWTLALDEGPRRSPVLSDGRVYLWGNDGLMALDAATGAVLWNVSKPVIDPLGGHAVGGGVLVVGFIASVVGEREQWERGFLEEKVEAFDAVTGERRWAVNVSRIAGEVLLLDGLAFVPLKDHGVLVLRLDDGTKVWSAAGRGADSRTQLAAEGGLVVAVNGGSAAAFRTSDGAVRWARDAGGVRALSIGTGRVYLGADRGVVALDLATGEEVWTTPLAGPVRSAPVVIGSALLVLADETDTRVVAPAVHVLDAASGAVQESREFREGVFDVTAGKHHAYFSLASGDVAAYDLRVGGGPP